MELTPGEEVIINLLRGEQAVDFVLNVAWLGPVWTVSISSEIDGILAGTGESFRQALHAAFGVEAGTGGGEESEAAPRPALRIVGGTRAKAAS